MILNRTEAPTFVSVEPCEHPRAEPCENGSATNPGQYYRGVLSRSLWTKNGALIPGSILKIERILMVAGATLDYAAIGVEDPHELRFMQPPNDNPPPLLTAGQLNEKIEHDTQPRVSTSRVVGFPDLLKVYRNAPIGKYALQVVESLPVVARATRLRTGPAEDGWYQIYPENSLIGVLLQPQVALWQAQAHIRGALQM